MQTTILCLSPWPFSEKERRVTVTPQIADIGGVVYGIELSTSSEVLPMRVEDALALAHALIGAYNYLDDMKLSSEKRG